MFQTSLLKNFSKSFNAPDESKIIKLLTKEKFILVYGLYGLSGDEVGIIEELK